MDGQNYVVFHSDGGDDSYMNSSANFRGADVGATFIDLFFASSSGVTTNSSTGYDKVRLTVTATHEEAALEAVGGALAGAKSGSTAVIADDYGSASCSDFISTSAGVTTISKATGGQTKRVMSIVENTTLVAGDSGTTVICLPTATTEIDLPALSAGLAGWNCRVILQSDSGFGGDELMDQKVNIDMGSGTANVGIIHGGDAGGSDQAVSGDDFIACTAAASPGDTFDFITDGTRWYVTGHVVDASETPFAGAAG